MNETIDNTNGRSWARFWLVGTLIVSIVANVTHAVLATSEISLWLRVPGGVLWPVLTFAAIEIVVRVTWARRFSHYLARTLVLGPAIPAVIISYEHQRSLLAMMGEGAFVSAIGPLAIDGLMIGCTLTLLFTRAIVSAPSVEIEQAEEPIAASAEVPSEPAIEPAPAPIEAPRVRRESGTDALSKAVSVLQDGGDTAAAAAASGLSAPTVRRYAAVVRALKLDPHAPIDARKLSVRSDVVDEIRAWARLESVR